MPTNDLFLITAATGQTGAPAIAELLQRGARVRALVHRLDERSQALADAGVEIVEGDLLNFDDVSSALIGVTGAYFCFPIPPGRLLEATALFVQAASEAGVRTVVNMSQVMARREAKSHAAQQHWLAERLLDRSALMTTHIRPTFFAEWLTYWWSREPDGGVIRLPFADGRHGPITGPDQGRVIASILANPAPHARQIYPLHGPVELNHYEIAEKMTETLGTPVRYEPITDAEFGKMIAAEGYPPFLVQHLNRVAEDYRAGLYAGTNNLVEAISGVPATTIEEFIAANRRVFDGPGLYGKHAAAVGE